MPIAFDPDATTLICLEADKARPEEQRVYFKCRFITRRESDRVWRLVDDAMEAAKSDFPACEKLLHEALAVGLVGPVNAKHPRSGEPLPCSIESIADVLTPAEVWELARQYPTLVALSENEKKASVSASGGRSEPTACAPTAAMASA